MVHAANAPLAELRFRKASWEDFARQLDVAVHGAVLLTQGFLAQGKDVRPESVLFVLSSVTRGRPPTQKSHYVTAKYGLLGLSLALATELAPKRIRVNCLSPGFVRTDLTAGVDDRIVDLIQRSVPLGRLCSPEDIAGMAAFLLSADACHLTGLNIPVDGGTTL